MSASLLIAILALVVSAVALWRTQLAPGRINATAGALRLRVYPFDRGGHRWVVPELHVSVAFTNVGARPVIVDTVRVIVRYTDIGSGDGRDTFGPVLTLRKPMGAGYESHKDRDRRLDEESEWMPTLVLPKDTAIRNIVLQSHAWDAPPMGMGTATLEIKVRGRAWQELKRGALDLSESEWHLIYAGMAAPVMETSLPDAGPVVSPPDLYETVAAEAEEALGSRWWEELQARSKRRDRLAAKARGEQYNEDHWRRRLR